MRKHFVRSRAIQDTTTTDADVDDLGTDILNADKRQSHSGRFWVRVAAYAVLPGLTLSLTLGAGYLKWLDATKQMSDVARTESVRAATDGTIAMLSYQPDTAEKTLTAAQDRMTGDLKNSYGSLIKDVVVPGAKEQKISAEAVVPAAGSVSASPDHAEVLVFVNQSIIKGTEAPTSTASRVRVTLDKVDGRWLIAGFDPI